MDRPIAPHGYEAHPFHAVVMGALRPVASSPPRPDNIHGVHAPLFSANKAEAWLREHGGWTRGLFGDDRHLCLLVLDERPGRLLSGGRGASRGSDLFACEGGWILPGAPPLPFQSGEAEAWPFVFLAVMDTAFRELPRWGEWAREQEIDVVRLHAHVHGRAQRGRR